MADGYTVENIRKVYNDTTGDYMEIGPDGDGLESPSIAAYCGTTREAYITFESPEQAVLVAQAIIELYGPKETVA